MSDDNKICEKENDKQYVAIIDGFQRYKTAIFNSNQEKIEHQKMCENNVINLINGVDNFKKTNDYYHIKNCYKREFTNDFLKYINNNGYEIIDNNIFDAILQYKNRNKEN